MKPTAAVVVQRMPSDFYLAELAGFEGILTVSKRVLDFALFHSSLLDEAFKLLIKEVLLFSLCISMSPRALAYLSESGYSQLARRLVATLYVNL